MVPEARLELAQGRAPGDFESPASTNSTTPATGHNCICKTWPLASPFPEWAGGQGPGLPLLGENLTNNTAGYVGK